MLIDSKEEFDSLSRDDRLGSDADRLSRFYGTLKTKKSLVDELGGKTPQSRSKRNLTIDEKGRHVRLCPCVLFLAGFGWPLAILLTS